MVAPHVFDFQTMNETKCRPNVAKNPEANSPYFDQDPPKFDADGVQTLKEMSDFPARFWNYCRLILAGILQNPILTIFKTSDRLHTKRLPWPGLIFLVLGSFMAALEFDVDGFRILHQLSWPHLERKMS